MSARPFFGFFVLGVTLLSGCGPTEMRYALSADSLRDLGEDAAVQEQLAAALDTVFGTPQAPVVTGAAAELVKSTPEQLAAGAAKYRQLCMHCHGLGGDGAGPTAVFVNPRPRDYRRGIFKFTSTAAGLKPTRDDLRQTLKNGVPGTSMPSFALFFDEDAQAMEQVLDYVVLLSLRGETERSVVGLYSPGDPITTETVQKEADEIIVPSWKDAEQKIVKPTAPKPPSADADSIKRGKELFLSEKVQCFNCHGRGGRGDGLTTDPKLTIDNWGNPSRPADLTLGVFRGGGRPIDLFRRIHASIKGTPMPAQGGPGGNLTDAQIWDLVNYVRTLAYEDQAIAQSQPAGGAESRHN